MIIGTSSLSFSKWNILFPLKCLVIVLPLIVPWEVNSRMRGACLLPLQDIIPDLTTVTPSASVLWAVNRWLGRAYTDTPFSVATASTWCDKIRIKQKKRKLNLKFKSNLLQPWMAFDVMLQFIKIKN